MIIEALWLMGGKIDWNGLPVVMDIIGLVDVEKTIRMMVKIIENR